eukprot:scaffold22461_cov35-Phaeocystis_antarctica.AAC.1
MRNRGRLAQNRWASARAGSIPEDNRTRKRAHLDSKRARKVWATASQIYAPAVSGAGHVDL